MVKSMSTPPLAGSSALPTSITKEKALGIESREQRAESREDRAES